MNAWTVLYMEIFLMWRTIQNKGGLKIHKNGKQNFNGVTLPESIMKNILWNRRSGKYDKIIIQTINFCNLCDDKLFHWIWNTEPILTRSDQVSKFEELKVWDCTVIQFVCHLPLSLILISSSNIKKAMAMDIFNFRKERAGAYIKSEQGYFST